MKTKKHANYYEAILQLRNPDADVDDLVHRVVELVRVKDQEDTFISKRKKVKNGVDLYLSSNTGAINIGRQLFREMGGELKVTKKIFSQHRMTSKVL